MTQKKIFLGFCTLIALLSLAVIWMNFKYEASISDLKETQVNRYESYLLADEMRQSSDDLTRLGRTYVVTGQQKYKDQYFRILNIRNGKEARPLDYHRIYWDFVAAGDQTPRLTGETIGLLTLMKQAGFTKEEFEKLDQAKANSDGLVNLEVEAMKVVEGQSDNLKIKDASQTEKELFASRMLNSDDYHSFKANIMKPVDEFYILLEKRTNSQIEFAEANNSFYSIMFSTILAFALFSIFGMCWFIYTRNLLSIEKLKDMMNEIVLGNYEQTPFLERNDEIGEMAASVEVFKDNAIKRTEVENERIVEREKASQATKDSQAKFADNFQKSIVGFIGNIGNSCSEMRGTADSLITDSQESTEETIKARSAAEKASVNVQTVASAAEELHSSIEEISRQVTESRNIVAEATDHTRTTNAKVMELSDAANNISEVITLIQSIAEQTNLLALNATIEAARAGDAGKGFAVVANEVKALASQTAKATDEISKHINLIQNSSTETAGSIETISAIMEKVNNITLEISNAMEEQGSATSLISENIQEAASETQLVASTMTDVTSRAEQADNAAHEVRNATEVMYGQTQELNTHVEKFVKKLLSA